MNEECLAYFTCALASIPFQDTAGFKIRHARLASFHMLDKHAACPGFQRVGMFAQPVIETSSRLAYVRLFTRQRYFIDDPFFALDEGRGVTLSAVLACFLLVDSLAKPAQLVGR